jgi:tRNA(fMet)-specific endonuclease VapC
MPYILDTNVVSALMRGEGDVEDRLLAEPRSSIHLIQPVISEIWCGIARLPTSKRREAMTARFELLVHTLPRAEWNDRVSARYGAVKAALDAAGKHIDDFDVAIAAHALAMDATVATRNSRSFDRVSGLDVEKW